RETGVGFADDDGFDRFSPRVIGDADHGHVGNLRMLGQNRLHLGRVDVFSARDDHVLDAVLDVDESVRVHGARVAGVEPAVANRVVGFALLAPVAGHGARAAVDDLADLPELDVPAIRPDDLEIVPEA